MKTKRILALLTALIIVFQLMPAVFADDTGDHAASVDGIGYTSLDEAFAAAGNEGKTVTVQKDIGTAGAPVGVTVSGIFSGTLDLNGHSVYIGSMTFRTDNCSIIFTDSSSENSGTLYVTALGDHGGLAPNTSRKITLSFTDVKVVSTEILFYSSGKSSLYINDGADIYCGGMWKDPDTFYGYGSINGNVDVYVTGGKFVVEKGQNIRVTGKAVISGGRVESLHSEAVREASKTTITGDAVVLGNALKTNSTAQNCTRDVHTGCKPEISGGYFNEPFVDGKVDYGEYGQVTKKTLSFLADEYMSDTSPVAEGEFAGLYGVRPAAAKVTQSNNTAVKYETVSQAYEALSATANKSGRVLRLYTDTDEAYAMHSGETLSIEPNGHSYPEPVPPQGFKLKSEPSDDGKSIAYSLAEDDMGVRLAGYSISLEGDIAVNFYMKLSEDVVESTSQPYMQFSIAGASQEYTSQKVYVSDAVTKVVGDETYYVFKCRISARSMASVIEAQLINGNEKSSVYSYTVKDYALYLIDHAWDSTEYAAAKPLALAMLHYGAAAQRQFGSTDPPADKYPDDTDIEGNDWENVTAGVINKPYDASQASLPEGTEFAGMTLSLKSETTLSLYFISEGTLAFSCEGMSVERSESGNYQIARIRGIPSKQLDDTFTVTLGGGYQVSVCPMTYCYNVLSDTTGSYGDYLKDVVKTLYRYSEEADAYFQ